MVEVSLISNDACVDEGELEPRRACGDEVAQFKSSGVIRCESEGEWGSRTENEEKERWL